MLRVIHFLVELFEKCVKISGLMKKRKLNFTCLIELRIMNPIFSTSIYLQIITRILWQWPQKICHAIFLFLRIFFTKPCQSHIVMFLQNVLLHWINLGSGQKCVTFKALLCGCFNPITVGNVAASYCKFTFTGEIFPQFVMASNVKM